MTDHCAELTVFEKTGGPLTKRIALRDGKICSDSADCSMANGIARRAPIDNVQVLADLINNFTSSEAYALGRLIDGVPDGAKVVVRAKLNGAGDPSIIARTKDYLVFGEGEVGFVLLDIDVKDMPDTVKHRIEECGDHGASRCASVPFMITGKMKCKLRALGYADEAIAHLTPEQAHEVLGHKASEPYDRAPNIWGALIEVLPALETVACVERDSTSSGLRNRETGETFPGSGGRHIVVPVLDAADIPRFLSDLHARCWLAGFGWGNVSAAGSFLERSLIDKSCGSPERLIFEGKPIVEPPLEQTSRDAVAHDGTILDTRLCAPLTDGERAELQKLIAAEERRLLPERQAARAAWSLKHIEQLTARGIPESEARTQVDRWIDRKELSGAFPLPFDDPKIAGTTVEQVLAVPDQYIEKTLSDPFEGPGYGRGKAKLFRHANGSLFIHSFAHGGITYGLKAETSDRRLILSSAEFVAGFVPPDYVVEGILQRRFLYSLTGKTGAGKTAIMLLLAAHIALGKAVGDRTIEIGKVLYLAGENADDVRMRWIAMAQQMDFEINAIDVHFIAGTFKLSEMHNRICTEIASVGEITLLLVDTSAAFFEGDSENDNKQAGDHARRMRRLIEVPGHPCVIVACHPTKNADDDNLIPRGGGAFLAEVDGNLTARASEGSIEVGTQGKFRGPDFTPLNFHLRTVTHERLKDSKGRLIPTVVASPLSETGREDIAKAMRSREDEMLVALLDPTNRKASKTELARRLGWKMRDGKPYHVQVARILKDLKKEKLITIIRREITLTNEGKKAAKQASGDDAAPDD